MDNGMTRKKVAVGFFKPQADKRKRVWLIISQFDEVQSSLRAVWKNHENELLESLSAAKYQYGTRFKTKVILGHKTANAVSANSALQHLGRDRFLKKKYFLAVVNCRHRRPCNQMPATSGSLGTERASQLILMTPIRAVDSEDLANHEILKLSSSAST